MKTVLKTLLLAVCGLLFASIAFGADLNLSWTDNSDNEDRFIVERAIDTFPFEPIGEVEANVTTYLDQDVPIGVVLSYRVVAENAYGRSAYSNVEVEETFPPAAPGDLVVSLAIAGASLGLAVLLLLFFSRKVRPRE